MPRPLGPELLPGHRTTDLGSAGIARAAGRLAAAKATRPGSRPDQVSSGAGLGEVPDV